jgi:hypothetical protein
MNRTAIMIFSFIAGSFTADVTHPSGHRLWAAPATEAITDSEVGCVDDCLMPAARPLVMACRPSWDKSFLECVVEE